MAVIGGGKYCGYKRDCEFQEIKKTKIEHVEDSDWISIKDKLPNNSGSFICVRKNGIISIEQFHVAHPENWTKFTCVTYWMKLPELPIAAQDKQEDL